MAFDFGVIPASAAALVFYFRLIRVQRRAGSADAGSPGAARPGLIVHWLPAVAGVLLAIAGAILAGTELAPGMQAWWWLPVTLGFVVLQFAV
jgi:hypothetical protein